MNEAKNKCFDTVWLPRRGKDKNTLVQPRRNIN